MFLLREQNHRENGFYYEAILFEIILTAFYVLCSDGAGSILKTSEPRAHLIRFELWSQRFVMKA